MLIRLALAVLAVLPALPAAADDCAACTAKKLCAPHEGADEAALKSAAPMLKDKDLMTRRDGIDRLAASASNHLNARSKKITVEIVRMLADPEPSVKGYAAEKLGEVGDEAMAVQSLAREAQNLEKAYPMDKPAKKEEQPKWEEQTRVLNSFYTGLAKTKSPLAVPSFEKGIRSACPWVVKLAAENCHDFKGSKAILKALIDQLAKYFASNVTEGNSAAWTAVSMALPFVSGCNDIPTQKDGADAARWNADWQKWWRENEKKLK